MLLGFTSPSSPSTTTGSNRARGTADSNRTCSLTSTKGLSTDLLPGVSQSCACLLLSHAELDKSLGSFAQVLSLCPS